MKSSLHYEIFSLNNKDILLEKRKDLKHTGSIQTAHLEYMEAPLSIANLNKSGNKYLKQESSHHRSYQNLTHVSSPTTNFIDLENSSQPYLMLFHIFIKIYKNKIKIKKKALK